MKTLTTFENQYINEGFLKSFLSGLFKKFKELGESFKNRMDASTELIKDKKLKEELKDKLADIADDISKNIKDADKLNELIEDKFDEYDEESVNSIKLSVFLQCAEACTKDNDKSGTEKAKKYIDKIKSKNPELVKKYAEQLNKINGEEGGQEQQEETPEEVVDNAKSVDKASRELGATPQKVKKAIQPIVQVKDSLDDVIFDDFVILEEKKEAKNKYNLSKVILDFKEKYLLGEKKKWFDKTGEQKETNKKAIVNLATAINAALENMVDKEQKQITKDELFEFIKELIADKTFSSQI